MAKRVSAGMKAVHKQESLDRLKALLKPNTSVWDIQTRRAKSGMSARYKFFVPDVIPAYGDRPAEPIIRDITLDVAIVTDSVYDRDSGDVKIDGCGLNRPQHMLDTLSYYLRPEGTPAHEFRLKQRSL
jgi:hypothetical protein